VHFSFFVFARFLQASLYIGKTGVIFFKKENIYVKLDSFNRQHGLDRNQLLAAFLLEGKTMMMGIILGITLSYIAVIVYLHQMSK
jgi:hypothetical protein